MFLIYPRSIIVLLWSSAVNNQALDTSLSNLTTNNHPGKFSWYILYYMQCEINVVVVAVSHNYLLIKLVFFVFVLAFRGRHHPGSFWRVSLGHFSQFFCECIKNFLASFVILAFKYLIFQSWEAVRPSAQLGALRWRERFSGKEKSYCFWSDEKAPRGTWPSKHGRGRRSI